MSDMVQNNEVTDCKVVNFPDLYAQKIKKQDWYTFAGFFPPGYHQVLIYDPKFERAYAKDIVVGMNLRDFAYPEYPLASSDFNKKIIPDMWQKWVEDTQEDINNIFQSELDGEDFNPKKIMKKQGEEEINKCMAIFKRKMKEIMVLQREMMSNSPSKYPEIGWEATLAFIDEAQSSNPELDNVKKMFRSQVELCFIGATRNDDTKGLKSAMQRSELLDFLLRTSQQFVSNNHGGKEPASNHLEFFMDQFVIKATIRSNIERHRRIIRHSRSLNELLYENHEGLSEIFEDAKKIPGNHPAKNRERRFTLECARQLFSQFNGLVAEGLGEICLRQKIIDDCFIFSMMTVLNEDDHMNKYQHLNFVEFQEMLCRIAIVSNKAALVIADKVYRWLEILYNQRYEQDVWTAEDVPLYAVQPSEDDDD